MTRPEIEKIHGAEDTFDTQQLQEKFTVKSFMAPFVAVTRKIDGMPGYLEFQAMPRLYFKFMQGN